MSVNRLPPVGRIRQSTEAGYYCFDEMFVWASELLDRFPDVIETIRGRFGEATAGGFPAISAVPGQFLLKDVVLVAGSLCWFVRPSFTPPRISMVQEQRFPSSVGKVTEHGQHDAVTADVAAAIGGSLPIRECHQARQASVPFLWQNLMTCPAWHWQLSQVLPRFGGEFYWGIGRYPE
jgi:hypothetical protein